MCRSCWFKRLCFRSLLLLWLRWTWILTIIVIILHQMIVILPLSSIHICYNLLIWSLLSKWWRLGFIKLIIDLIGVLVYLNTWWTMIGRALRIKRVSWNILNLRHRVHWNIMISRRVLDLYFILIFAFCFNFKVQICLLSLMYHRSIRFWIFSFRACILCFDRCISINVSLCHWINLHSDNFDLRTVFTLDSFMLRGLTFWLMH